MIHELTDTQKLLNDAAARLCRQPAGRHEHRDPAAMWGRYVELGWLALAVPEALDGAGGTLEDAAAIVFEMGQGAVFDAFGETVAVALALAEGDLTAAGRGVLASVATGSLALAAAKRPGHGEPTLVHVQGAPDALVVRVRDDGGVPRLTAARLSTLASTPVRTTAPGKSLLVDSADGEEAVLAEGAAATDAWRRIDSGVRLLACVQLLGGARQLHAMAVDYARIRSQFGHPIAHYQAVQHQLVDMLNALDGAELLTFRSLTAGNGEPEADLLAALSVTRRAAWDCVMATYNILGGVGFMEEHPVNAYMRGMLPLIARLGASGALHERMAETVQRGCWLA